MTLKLALKLGWFVGFCIGNKVVKFIQGVQK